VDSGHPLAAVLRDAAHGRFPDFEGVLQVMPALDGIAAGLFGFSGHTIVSTDLDESELMAQLPGEDPGAPMTPSFIAWLERRLGARGYTPDLVLVAFHGENMAAPALTERPDLMSHPRALIAQRLRKDVRAYSEADRNGLLTIGYGVCGRIEVSIEVEPALRGHGLGGRLALAARSLAPVGEPVFASVSPGNAASLRAFLAAGYVPIGSEVLLAHRTVRGS
jgi:GNAT superfamily N-acetyltransferase